MFLITLLQPQRGGGERARHAVRRASSLRDVEFVYLFFFFIYFVAAVNIVVERRGGATFGPCLFFFNFRGKLVKGA